MAADCIASFRNFTRSLLRRNFPEHTHQCEKLERLIFNHAVDMQGPTLKEFRLAYNWATQLTLLHKSTVEMAINGEVDIRPLDLVQRLTDKLGQDVQQPTGDPRAALRLYALRTLGQFLGEPSPAESAIASCQPSAPRYKKQLLMVLSSLKKPDTRLAERVNNGEISPSSLGTATHRDLWPELWARPTMQPGHKAIVYKENEEFIAPSLLQCGHCKQFTVRTREFQTRSADEPMTVFCLCTKCGKRWKF